jgi:hypothetical protein
VSFPALSVKVAFASNPYDSTLTFTEIGPASGLGPGGFGWVRSIQSKRGRERLLRSAAQFEAGTLRCALDNRDRRFDPTNTSSPYYPNVLPEKVIQVGATWAGTFYPIWTGYVDDWPQTWPGFSEAEVPLVATDYFKALSVYRLLSSGYDTQVLADGAIAYWKLDEPAGSTVSVDSGPNHFNSNRIINAGSGVVFGGAGPLIANPGTSVLLTATSQGEIDWPSTGLSNTNNNLTVDFWFNHTSTGDQVFVSIPSPSAAQYAAIDFGVATAGKWTCAAALGTSAVLQSPSAYADGLWHHFMFTANATTSALYIDGVSVGVAGGFPAFHPSIPNISANGGAGSFSLARLAVYQSTLTAVQAALHFQLAAFPAEATGERVRRVLNVLGFPTGRRTVDTGRTQCAADVTQEFNTRALDYLQKLEQTEQGQCYIRADGNLVFQDRYHRYESPAANVQAVFGDGGAAFPSEIPYPIGGVTLNFDRMELFNDIPVTRRGGNLQDAQNAASITSYGNRVMGNLSDLLMATDQDAFYAAQWILADTAQPQFRVGDLVLNPHLDDRLWPLVLGLDIGAVITVNKHNIPGGGTLSLNCRIEGIEHQVDAPYEWITTWHVSLVGTNPWFILDDPVMGLLDHGNRLGW